MYIIILTNDCRVAAIALTSYTCIFMMYTVVLVDPVVYTVKEGCFRASAAQVI